MKIAVLLSGGVDSSVALRRVLDTGHEATAFYLKIWLEDELAFLGECPWEEDLQYARAVCEQAHVPLEVVPFQRQYRERIVDYTVRELKAGRTPSSDVLCNREIKFGAFLDWLDETHPGVYDKVASGHYARVEERTAQPGKPHFRLLRNPDPVKDQTYFLCRLTQAQLARCLFPLGELTKSEVRALAARYALPNQDRPDSQGICFLGRIPFDEFIHHHLGEQPGDIREAETGKVLGQHRGYWFHTIGQRKGLGLSGGPWYVVAKDAATNTLTVSHKEDLPTLAPDRFQVTDLHWIEETPDGERTFDLKVRHAAGHHRGTVRPVLESPNAETWEVQLDEPDSGLAPGQFVVFYDGAVCWGSGVIG